jgi:hypothetical protein
MGRLARLVVFLALATASCQLPWYTVHNLSFETCRCVDEHREDRDIEKMAAAAWERTGCKAAGRRAHGDDFQAGFFAGFAYWVKRGGDGEPPPVPPESYWRESYRSPSGQAQIQDWFEGYRLGTRTAREGHYREQQLVPLSRPLMEELRPEARQDAALPIPRMLEQAPDLHNPAGPIIDALEKR